MWFISIHSSIVLFHSLPPPPAPPPPPPPPSSPSPGDPPLGGAAGQGSLGAGGGQPAPLPGGGDGRGGLLRADAQGRPGLGEGPPPGADAHAGQRRGGRRGQGQPGGRRRRRRRRRRWWKDPSSGGPRYGLRGALGRAHSTEGKWILREDYYFINLMHFSPDSTVLSQSIFACLVYDVF